jgi:hypothetical protein
MPRTISRRGLLTTAAAATVAVPAAISAAPADASTTTSSATAADGTGAGLVTVTPDDPRYVELTTGVNQRWVGTPGRIYVPSTTEDVVAAVRDAVRAGQRVSLMSGGHCLADFVFNPQVQTVINLSTMNAVRYDPQLRAFEVEAGGILLNVYDTLYKSWGVTIPGGLCYSVGIGGHVSGGGFGLLSRSHGLTVDHLYAIEVVVVDADGEVHAVVATREPDDPNQDLWWGYSGGGGGSFGVITRYWFRSPDATGTDPGALLVRPPEKVLISILQIPWSGLTEERFNTLLGNVGDWFEANSAPDSPYTALSGSYTLSHVSAGAVTIATQIDATIPGARDLLAAYQTAITAGVEFDLSTAAPPLELPWLRATRFLGTASAIGDDPAVRSDNHSAYLITGFTGRQPSVIYKWLTSDAIDNPNAMVVINLVGGQISAVAPDATAVAQRTAVLKVLYQSLWTDSADDAANVAWATGLYREVYAETGGVPVPNGHTDGCYINYPDTALDGAASNTSGVPWQVLYHKGNLPRLQQVKARWDPTDFFRHPLSIPLPGH